MSSKCAKLSSLIKSLEVEAQSHNTFDIMDQVLKEIDPEGMKKGRSESLENNVVNFGLSLRAVTGLEGLLKAKSHFLEFIDRAESSKDELKKEVDKEWEAIAGKPITLQVGQIDFTDLEEHFIALAEEEEEKASKMEPVAIQPLGNGPPPPPPGPPGPPPPPGRQ